MSAVTRETYGGKYVVEFSPAAHRYKIFIRGEDGQLSPYNALPDGVTTICNAIVPKYLTKWAAKAAVDHVKTTLKSPGFKSMGDEKWEIMWDEAITAHERLRDSAGDRGSEAHDYIEAVLKGEKPVAPTNEAVLRSVASFEKWKTVVNPEIIEAERIVFSKELFYCGKCDLYAMVKGRRAIIDFKTGSGLYDDHVYQLTGYAVAIEEEEGVIIEDGYIVHLDKKEAEPKVYHFKLHDGLKDAWTLGVRHYKELKKIQNMVKETKSGIFYSKSAA